MHGSETAYFTPDECDHQFCYQCITSALTRDVKPPLFKCPVCDGNFKNICLYH